MSTTDHKISEVVDTVEALHIMVTKAFAVDKEIEQRFQSQIDKVQETERRLDSTFLKEIHGVDKSLNEKITNLKDDQNDKIQELTKFESEQKEFDLIAGMDLESLHKDIVGTMVVL